MCFSLHCCLRYPLPFSYSESTLGQGHPGMHRTSISGILLSSTCQPPLPFPPSPFSKAHIHHTLSQFGREHLVYGLSQIVLPSPIPYSQSTKSRTVSQSSTPYLVYIYDQKCSSNSYVIIPRLPASVHALPPPIPSSRSGSAPSQHNHALSHPCKTHHIYVHTLCTTTPVSERTPQKKPPIREQHLPPCR